MYLSFIVCLGGAIFGELDNENVYISLDFEKLCLTPFFFYQRIVLVTTIQAENEKEQCSTCVIIISRGTCMFPLRPITAL